MGAMFIRLILIDISRLWLHAFAMKWLRLFPLVVATCLLAGCVTLCQSDREVLRRHDVSAALYSKMVPREPISLPEVVELSQHGVPPKFIVHYLGAAGLAYRITEDDIRTLRQEGVSEEVIHYIRANPPINMRFPYPYNSPRFLYRTDLNTFPPPYYPGGNGMH